MQKYIGALNFREQIRSCITPCGSFVFSGSEDNFAYAWNTDTGMLHCRTTVNPLLRDHIKQDRFLAFQTVGCCMKVVQKAAGAFCATFMQQ